MLIHVLALQGKKKKPDSRNFFDFLYVYMLKPQYKVFDIFLLRVIYYTPFILVSSQNQQSCSTNVLNLRKSTDEQSWMRLISPRCVIISSRFSSQSLYSIWSSASRLIILFPCRGQVIFIERSRSLPRVTSLWGSEKVSVPVRGHFSSRKSRFRAWNAPRIRDRNRIFRSASVSLFSSEEYHECWDFSIFSFTFFFFSP